MNYYTISFLLGLSSSAVFAIGHSVIGSIISRRKFKSLEGIYLQSESKRPDRRSLVRWSYNPASKRHEFDGTSFNSEGTRIARFRSRFCSESDIPAGMFYLYDYARTDAPHIGGLGCGFINYAPGRGGKPRYSHGYYGAIGKASDFTPVGYIRLSNEFVRSLGADPTMLDDEKGQSKFIREYRGAIDELIGTHHLEALLAS